MSEFDCSTSSALRKSRVRSTRNVLKRRWAKKREEEGERKKKRAIAPLCVVRVRGDSRCSMLCASRDVVAMAGRVENTRALFHRALTQRLSDFVRTFAPATARVNWRRGRRKSRVMQYRVPVRFHSVL